MTPCPDAETLAAFAVGAMLSDDETAVVSVHLMTCGLCSDAVANTPPDPFSIRLRNVCSTSRPTALRTRLIGSYELLSEIGRGGCGIVYRARQPGTGRLIALKRLKAGALADAEELLRFHREGHTLARLTHPGIVQVYDVGEQEGEPYLAMELIEGESLTQRLRQGPLAARTAAELVHALAAAVAAAHAQGIIHRDLKPANILLPASACEVARGRESLSPKIADFGLAKCFQSEGSLTTVGLLVGTPAYMAPEQIEGPSSGVGPACDIYGLGAILYECLTGRPPHTGASHFETLQRVKSADIERPRQLVQTVPLGLEAICLKCLARDRMRRYASSADLAEDLRRFLNDETISARSPTLADSVRRIVRRYPVRCVVAVALIAAVVGGIAHEIRLQREIDRANARTDEANAERKRVVALFFEGHKVLRDRTNEVVSLIDNADPAARPLIDEHLRFAVDYAERLAAAVPARDTYVDLAYVHRIAAVANMSRNDNATVLRHLELSAQAMGEVLTRAPGDDDVAAEAARIDVCRSLAIIEEGRRTAEGVRLFNTARDTLHGISRSHPDPEMFRNDIEWVDSFREHVETTAQNAGLEKSGSEVAESK
jgi:eukaryotic-like serine/threonine-protein kinase